MKKLIILIILFVTVGYAYADTAVVGSMWKQENSELFPADDIVSVNFTGFSTVGLGASGGFSQDYPFANVSSTNVAVASTDYGFNCDASNGSVTFDMLSTFSSSDQPIYEFTVTDATNKCFIDGNGAQTITVDGVAFAIYSGLNAIGKTLRVQGTGDGYINRSKSNGKTAAFKAHRGGAGDLTVTSGVWTKFKTTVESYDNTGEYLHDADDSGGATESRFTATIAGKYRFFAVIQMVDWSGTVNHALNMEFRKNGNQTGVTTSHTTTAAGYTEEHVVSYELAAGDYVELWISQNTGGDRDIEDLERFSHFSGELIVE